MSENAFERLRYRFVLVSGVVVTAVGTVLGVASIVFLGFEGETMRDYVGCLVTLAFSAVVTLVGAHIGGVGLILRNRP